MPPSSLPCAAALPFPHGLSSHDASTRGRGWRPPLQLLQRVRPQLQQLLHRMRTAAAREAATHPQAQAATIIIMMPSLQRGRPACSVRSWASMWTQTNWAWGRRVILPLARLVGACSPWARHSHCTCPAAVAQARARAPVRLRWEARLHAQGKQRLRRRHPSPRLPQLLLPQRPVHQHHHHRQRALVTSRASSISMRRLLQAQRQQQRLADCHQQQQHRRLWLLDRVTQPLLQLLPVPLLPGLLTLTRSRIDLSFRPCFPPPPPLPRWPRPSQTRSTSRH